MSNWIFTVTKQKNDDTVVTAREIFEQRMQDCFWGIGNHTPNRKNLQVGDRVVFYIGIPERVFAGTATVATPFFKLSPQEREELTHGNHIYYYEYGIKLKEIVVWGKPKLVPDLVANLKFIENKEYWGSYFQGGVRGLTDEDYSVITSNGAVVKDREEDESVKQFALEAHLEEFIHANWNRIAWNRNIRLYETPESNGRQFPAGTWSIDFLAIDNDTDDLIVIELKRGQTSDSTVGQVLRYIGWVQENIAVGEQSVKGIIICRAVDDALRYAVSNIKDIEVLTYQVNFELKLVAI